MLEDARHDLKINTALEARITVVLEQLKQTAPPPPDVITDFKAYLGRVRAMGVDIDANPSETKSDSEVPRKQTASELESEPSPTGTTAGEAVRKDDSGLLATSTGHTAEGVQGDRQKRTGSYAAAMTTSSPGSCGKRPKGKPTPH